MLPFMRLEVAFVFKSIAPTANCAVDVLMEASSRTLIQFFIYSQTALQGLLRRQHPDKASFQASMID